MLRSSWRLLFTECSRQPMVHADAHIMFYGTKISGHYAGRDGKGNAHITYGNVDVKIVWSNANGDIMLTSRSVFLATISGSLLAKIIVCKDISRRSLYGQDLSSKYNVMHKWQKIMSA
jgi:hypothetical protein